MKPDPPVIIVLIGPTGCGKTTIGQLLAQKLGYPFDDGDDFHPPENVEKMRAGIPLDDADRMGWLTTLSRRIRDRKEKGEGLVLACSALKEPYRALLGIDQNTVISVYLKGSFDLIKERIDARRHRYMNKNLLFSQMAAMEAPAGGLTVDIGGSPEKICDTILAALNEYRGCKQ